jgi:hypothetical protein
MKPTQKPRGKCIPPDKGLIKSVHWARNICEKSIVRLIQTDHLDAVACFDVGAYELAHCLRRTAVFRRKARDDVKYMNNAPRSVRW